MLITTPTSVFYDKGHDHRDEGPQANASASSQIGLGIVNLVDPYQRDQIAKRCRDRSHKLLR